MPFRSVLKFRKINWFSNYKKNIHILFLDSFQNEINFTNPACSLVVRHLAIGKQQVGIVSINVGVALVKNGFIKLNKCY